MRDNSWLVLVCTALAVGVVVGYHYWHKRVVRLSVKGHLVSRTYSDLMRAKRALVVLTEIEDRAILMADQASREMSGADIYEAISQSRLAIEAADIREREQLQQALCDAWGRQIHARVGSMGARVHVKLWSDGPNQRDDGGQGDDICVEFELEAVRDNMGGGAGAVAGVKLEIGQLGPQRLRKNLRLDPCSKW